MTTSHTDDELDEFVDQLAIAHRAQRAYWHLRLTGPTALPAVRRGLRHEHDEVRRLCCVLLDHLADEESFADLIAMLDDPAPPVRLHALHALACDRCKQGDCRPDAREVLPRALHVLARDPDPHTRAMAVEVVGLWVHTDAASEAALVKAHAEDPSPAVRKKAGWYAPGGAVYRRTRPKPARL